MERVKILDWTIEVDRANTKTFQGHLLTPSISCGCLYCQNFEKAVPNLPKKFVEVLTELGIDENKPAEVYKIYEVEKGLHFYGGWYHFIGRFLEGEDSYSATDEKTRQAKFQQLDKGFSIGFTTTTNLVAKDFPRPVLQIEFTGTLPWLLDETP